MTTTTITRPGYDNLLSLILGNIIERNLDNPKIIQKIQKLDCAYSIKASKMQLFLILKDGSVILSDTKPAKITAHIEGKLGSFLNIALGKWPILDVITRKIKFNGNVFALIKLRQVMMANKYGVR